MPVPVPVPEYLFIMTDEMRRCILPITMSKYFDHEKLDVYKTAIEFIVLVDQLIIVLPRGRAYLVDQVQRAASSIALNIAEGAGEYSSNEKIRFYRMAK